MPMASGAYVKHAEWFLAIFLVDVKSSTVQCKMIKERDGVEVNR